MAGRYVPVLFAAHLGLLACSAGDDGSADASATIASEGATATTTATSDETTTATATATTGATTTTTSTATSDGTTTSTSATSQSTTAGETDTATTGDPPPAGACDPLPPPAGAVVDVTPAEAAQLPQIVGDAASGTTILLADGTYDLSGGGPLHFTTAGVALRSASGDPGAVILDAGYAVGEIALVAASDVTIAEITLQRAMWHPIHVTGGADEDTSGVVIHRVRVIDPGQQAIKINASPAGFYTDDGVVTCSTITLTDAGRPEVDGCYTGGVDAHSARGWLVADNTIEGFWCAQGLSEHAIHFWVTSRDTDVVRNTIVDCARGIGFGLGQSGNGKARVYDDDPCPGAGYLGHVDGVIRNNMILAKRPELFASQSGFDAGIALEQACGAVAVHNTIVSLEPPFVSIEYRWENTSAVIENNLVTHNIVARDGGMAELAGNLEGAPLSAVIDAAGGDLHLSAGSPAIDAGVVLEPGVCDDDFDGEVRDGMPDVGADERAG